MTTLSCGALGFKFFFNVQIQLKMNHVGRTNDDKEMNNKKLYLCKQIYEIKYRNSEICS